MNKKITTVFIIFISIFTFSGCTKQNTDLLDIPSDEIAPPPVSVTSEVLINTNNDLKLNEKYVPFSKQIVESSTDKRRVLFFYANWCPTCIPVDKELTEKMASIPEDVVVIRVNYNDTETDQDEKELATKYAVTYQHTFVQIDENGNSITKWNGGQLDKLLSNLQ